MEVKIYREKENENLILDEDQLKEYHDLAEKLGISNTTKEDRKVPVVYPILNTAMRNRLKALCPAIVEVNKYKRTTIPLEVLQVYDFAVNNKMFEAYEIWYDDVAPDPVLIGKRYDNAEDRTKGYSWLMNSYLLARWGDCAMEIPELMEAGQKRITNALIEQATAIAAKCQAVLSAPEIYANKVANNNASDISEIKTGLPF